MESSTVSPPPPALVAERKRVQREKRAIHRMQTPPPVPELLPSSARDNDDHDAIVSLNAGGTILQARKGTMCLYPDTKFSRLFSSRQPPPLADDQGRVFLDHDPALVGALVDHLRLKRLERDAARDHRHLASESAQETPPPPSAPLPWIPEGKKPAFDWLLWHFGLTRFFYPPPETETGTSAESAVRENPPLRTENPHSTTAHHSCSQPSGPGGAANQNPAPVSPQPNHHRTDEANEPEGHEHQDPSNGNEEPASRVVPSAIYVTQPTQASDAPGGDGGDDEVSEFGAGDDGDDGPPLEEPGDGRGEVIDIASSDEEATDWGDDDENNSEDATVPLSLAPSEHGHSPPVPTGARGAQATTTAAAGRPPRTTDMTLTEATRHEQALFQDIAAKNAAFSRAQRSAPLRPSAKDPPLAADDGSSEASTTTAELAAERSRLRSQNRAQKRHRKRLLEIQALPPGHKRRRDVVLGRGAAG